MKLKAVCLLLSAALFAAGWVGYSYFSFQNKMEQSMAAKDLKTAGELLNGWTATPAGKIVKSILPQIKQSMTMQKGWLLAQSGDFENAAKEFRKAAETVSPKTPDALFNAATIALAQGNEALERVADDLVKMLREAPNDFKGKVNLEIVKIKQNQAKQQGQSGKPGEGEKKQKIKKFRSGEKNEGPSEEQNEGLRY